MSGKQPISDGTRVAPLGYDRKSFVAKSILSPKPSAVSINPRKSLREQNRSVTSAQEIYIRPYSETSYNNLPISRKSISEPVPKPSKCPVKLPLWCLQKDYGIFINFVFFILGTAVFLSIIIIFSLLITKVVRQQDANINGPSAQTGKFAGEACNSSRDCSSQAVCQLNTCQCTIETYYDSYYGKCLPLKSYAQACLETRECSQFYGLICSNSFCTCPIQTVWANYYGRQECIRTREVGETCTSTSHCVGNSICSLVSSTYRCSCASTQFLSGVTGQCETIRKVNERCYNWYQECPSLTTCRPNNNGDGTYFCQCIEGTYYDIATLSCIKTQTIFGTCDVTSTCNTITGLYCFVGKCVCPNNQFWNGTYCQYYSSYGRPCSSVQLCSLGDPNLICGIPQGGVVQQMCYCANNYYFDEYLQQCLPLKSEGTVCYESSECVDNATCIGKMCTCYPGYWSHPTTGECELESSYGDVCSTAIGSKPCNNIVYGINCFNNTCICNPTYEFWDGTNCDTRRYYQETCSATILCATYRGLACSTTCYCPSPLSWNTAYNWCI